MGEVIGRETWREKAAPSPLCVMVFSRFVYTHAEDKD